MPKNFEIFSAVNFFDPKLWHTLDDFWINLTTHDEVTYSQRRWRTCSRLALVSSSNECFWTSQFIVEKLGVRTWGAKGKEGGSRKKIEELQGGSIGGAGEKEQEMRSRRIGAGEKELESRDEELERRSKRKGAELSLTLTSGLKGSFEWGPNKSYNITSMSFELQEWFSSQNWSDFCQEFISELQFAPAGSHQLRAALVRSRQLGALLCKRI